MSGHAGQTANGKRLETAVEAVQAAAAALSGAMPGGAKIGDYARITDKLRLACDRLAGALGTQGAIMADTAAAAGEHALAEDYANGLMSAAKWVNGSTGELRSAAHGLKNLARAVRGTPAGGNSGQIRARKLAAVLDDAAAGVEILKVGDVDIGTHARVVLLYRQALNGLRNALNALALRVDEAISEELPGEIRPFNTAHDIQAAADQLESADKHLHTVQGLF